MQWPRRVRPGTVALAVLSAVTIVLVVLAVQRASAPPPVYLPARQSPVAPSVAFVGDSFTSGTADGGRGPANYTQLLGSRFGWTVTNAAADGAGYVASPAPGGSFREAQLPKAVAARPALVVVQGSRTDADVPTAEVDAAARRLYAELRQALPQARIVVIGPIWASDGPPDTVTQTRDTVRDAATAARLPFLDPIAEGWFDAPDPDAPDPDADQGLVAADGQHLTDEGHRRLADRVGEGLRRVGAVPR